MNRSLLSAIVGLVLLIPSSLLAQAQYVPGNIMVMLAPGVHPENVVSDLRSVDGIATGLVVDKELSAPMRAWLLKFDIEAIAQQKMLQMVNAHPAVQMAQNDHIVTEREVPNDTQYGQQWHHQNIASETAWDITTGGLTATGDTIVVCIIENSDLPHPDLIGNAWFNHFEIPNNNIDDDVNGYVDDFRGWNTPGGDDDVYGGSHGTQVAGMIGAKGDNGAGVAGANWNVKMMVVDYGGVQESAVVAAYTYPLVMRRMYNETNGEKGAFVVATNASWGIDGGQPSNSPLWCAMFDTLGTAGILSCGATSNSNVNIDQVGDLPTACPSEHLVSVTATNSNDQRTFSAYGATHVDLGAPGEDVVTTSIGGGIGSTSGTSFASPLTAGVIGLLYSAPCASLMDLVHSDPSAGALYVRDALFAGVDPVAQLNGQTVTGGRINSANSLEWIMGQCGSCPAPFGLAAEWIDSTDHTLSWTSINGEEFDLYYRPLGTEDWTVVNSIEGDSYLAEGLIPCTEYEFQVSAACGSEESPASQTFVFTSEGCCVAPEGISTGTITTTSATITWEGVFAAGAYEIRYREVGSTDWTTVTVEGTSFELTGLGSCASYELQGRSSCDGEGSEWSESIFFNAFCPSASEDSDFEHIETVVFGSINNNSENDGGYGDYTHLGTTVEIGGTYPISLTPGYDGFGTYEEHFRVYIDLDQDGSFTGPGELVFDAPDVTTSTITGNITIPTTATPGGSRMRVIMNYDEPIANACVDGYEFGETEDYCVTITAATSIQAAAEQTGISIYPDPADQELFIEINGITDRSLELSILDNTGRQIISRAAIANGRSSTNTASLANGLYIYRILQNDQEIGRGKFMVVH